MRVLYFDNCVPLDPTRGPRDSTRDSLEARRDPRRTAARGDLVPLKESATSRRSLMNCPLNLKPHQTKVWIIHTHIRFI